MMNISPSRLIYSIKSIYREGFMEEKQIEMKRAHRLTMEGRRCAAITGVSDVLSFDVGEVVLQTEDGLLMIKGEELHVSRLTLEKGEVDLDGKIDSLTYTGSQGKKADRNGSRFKRMFQ
jgi:sporulation protein YabP